MKAIIPAAGFGTRVGMKSNKSKEMLPDPVYGYKRIIDYSLTLCKIFKLDPLIITREEKKDLRQYLFNEGVKFINIEPGGEWNDSVLESRNEWDEENILILPDTRFYSPAIIEQIEQGLKLGNNAVFAMHKVKDPENWGIISDYYLIDKSKEFTGEKMAWGLIGFKNYYGEDLFHRRSHIHLENVGFNYLTSFIDITRGKK